MPAFGILFCLNLNHVNQGKGKSQSRTLYCFIRCLINAANSFSCSGQDLGSTLDHSPSCLPFQHILSVPLSIITHTGSQHLSPIPCLLPLFLRIPVCQLLLENCEALLTGLPASAFSLVEIISPPEIRIIVHNVCQLTWFPYLKCKQFHDYMTESNKDKLSKQPWNFQSFPPSVSCSLTSGRWIFPLFELAPSHNSSPSI